MEPDDRTVDRDADPTRVRPDRQAAHRMPEDADGSPTTVRPRSLSAELRADNASGPADVVTGYGTDAGTGAIAPGGPGTAGDAGAGHGFSADGDPGRVDPGDLDRWVGPASRPRHGRFDEVAADGDDRGAASYDVGAADERAWYEDLDGAPTTADSFEPSHPSHRRPSWNPVQEWNAGGADAAGADPVAHRSGFADDPDGGPTTVLTVVHDAERRFRRPDWAWVEEWRAERSAPAWGPGIAMAAFVALIVAVALIVLTSGVSDSPVLAVVFNVIIAAGMAPALWMCRSLPVLRFLAAGAAAGILLGWIAMLTTF